MNKKETPESIFNKALELKKESKSICDVYRKTIVVLKLKEFSYKDIEKFFSENSLKIKSYVISQYLKKKPISDKEKTEYKQYIK
ncbi:MAG TPA: hypothetical protein QF753_19855 [Victivallales bacterium]|nr:hypothetical protein [Victivallales bacterium]|tara:strand:+ start:312 stop:563 length:252 start_codon:yes stop_codon:yes gene_type:complete